MSIDRAILLAILLIFAVVLLATLLAVYLQGRRLDRVEHRFDQRMSQAEKTLGEMPKREDFERIGAAFQRMTTDQAVVVERVERMLKTADRIESYLLNKGATHA